MEQDQVLNKNKHETRANMGPAQTWNTNTG